MVRRGGFSLVEAQIALTMFAAGILSIAAIGVRSAAVLRTAEARQGAQVAGLSIADSLVQTEHPQDGAAVRGRYALRWVTLPGSRTTRIRVHIGYTDGSRAMTDSVDAIAAVWPVRLSRVP